MESRFKVSTTSLSLYKNSREDSEHPTRTLWWERRYLNMLYHSEDEGSELYLPHGLVPGEDSTNAFEAQAAAGGYDKFRSPSADSSDNVLFRFSCKVLLYTILIAASLFVAFFVPVLLNGIKNASVDSNTIITSESVDGYSSWQNSAEKSIRYKRIFVFNITNPHEFLKGKKVHVQECGPFVYSVVKKKLDVAWDQYGTDQVSFRDWTHHTFDREKTLEESRGKYKTDNETFTVGNTFFWGMEPQAGEAIWKLYFKDHTPYDRMFTKISIHDLINGYGKEPFAFPGLQPNQLHPSDAPPPNTQRVGAIDKAAVGQLLRWRDMSKLSVVCPWANDGIKDNCSPSKFPCCGGTTSVWQTPSNTSIIPEEENEGLPNVVTGTSGAQFAPGNQSHVAIFVDALSRHVKLHRAPEILNYYGVDLTKYSLPWTNPAVGNATTFPYNANYYMFGPRGIQNGTMIEKGAPIYFSMPHFLGVGKEASDRVIGLAPDINLHETFLGVTPLLGLTFLAKQRLQINVQARQIVFKDNETWFPDIMPGRTYIPVAWIEEASECKKDVAERIRDSYALLHGLTVAAFWSGITMAIISVILLSFSFYKYYSTLENDKEVGEQLISPSDSDKSYGSFNESTKITHSS